MSREGGSGGLESVVVADTAICRIDGLKGELEYRGYPIAELAGHASFEEAAHLLWLGDAPDSAALDVITTELARGRLLPPGIADLARSFPRAAPPMDSLRTLVSALRSFRPGGCDGSPSIPQAIRLTGAVAAGVALIERSRRQLTLPEARPDLGHAGNMLWMMLGEPPERSAVAAFDAALILHMEHGFNASTFAARVASSTLADLHAAVTAAIGTLSGPLHGGANERVMAMLETVGSPERAKEHVNRLLDDGERVMGFGHRVYRTVDPRATILRDIANGLARENDGDRWLAVALAVEEAVADRLAAKGIAPNVDFFSAVLYRSLGISSDLFTPIFAAARVVGWTAHALEQRADNRLIRPRANYVGPATRPWPA